MFDPQVIATLLHDSWIETNPVATDIMFAVDEYDPKKPALQIVCENADLPKEEFIIDTVFKTVQVVKITVFLKPIRYVNTELNVNKVIFYNVLAEIDRIIRSVHRGYTATEYNSIPWRRVIIPKGMGVQPEPLTFQAEKLITITEYIA